MNACELDGNVLTPWCGTHHRPALSCALRAAKDAEISALRAENARLREALETAVRKWDYTNDGMRSDEGTAEYRKARQALKEAEP